MLIGTSAHTGAFTEAVVLELAAVAVGAAGALRVTAGTFGRSGCGRSPARQLSARRALTRLLSAMNV
jgi:hypothetical protein